jgi:serine/threonine protein kinase
MGASRSSPDSSLMARSQSHLSLAKSDLSGSPKDHSRSSSPKHRDRDRLTKGATSLFREQHSLRLLTTKIEERKVATSRDDVHKVYLVSAKELGVGRFGEVRRAKYFSHSGKNFAVKSIRKVDVQEDVLYLKREVQIFQTLDHPNIVRFHEVYQSKDHIHIVVDHCDRGNLRSKLDAETRFSETDTRAITYQLLLALHYLHSLHICHRDVKPDNALLDSTASPSGHPSLLCRLTDFGLSRLESPTAPFSTLVGTPHFVAPEVITRSYDKLCDLWSLGVMVFLFLSGSHPFSGPNNQAIFDAILRADPDFSLPVWHTVSPLALDFVRRTLVRSPLHRLSAAQALSHPWFQPELDRIHLTTDSFLSRDAATRLVQFAPKSLLEWEILRTAVAMFDTREDLRRLRALFVRADRQRRGVLDAQDVLAYVYESVPDLVSPPHTHIHPRHPDLLLPNDFRDKDSSPTHSISHPHLLSASPAKPDLSLPHSKPVHKSAGKTILRISPHPTALLLSSPSVLAKSPLLHSVSFQSADSLAHPPLPRLPQMPTARAAPNGNEAEPEKEEDQEEQDLAEGEQEGEEREEEQDEEQEEQQRSGLQQASTSLLSQQSLALQSVLDKPNLSQTGRITLTEFLLMSMDSSFLAKDKYAMTLFSRFDTDLDGTITHRDIAEYFARQGILADHSLTKSMLGEFIDEVLPFREFQQICNRLAH